MKPHPRFRQEYFIRQNIDELQSYATVFAQRISKAFDNLESEAEDLQASEYKRISASWEAPDEDDSAIAEKAYFAGVDFYIMTDAIRVGIINLMVAGLYHLFEQHAAVLADRELPPPVSPPKSPYPGERLHNVVQGLGVDITTFRTWQQLNELRLIANTVKHGDGKSAEDLRQIMPHLFERFPSLIDPAFAVQLPLRPLVGEGIYLTEDHFNTYKKCLDEFWTELADALASVFCPGYHHPPESQ